jgi:hypothetical protein
MSNAVSLERDPMLPVLAAMAAWIAAAVAPFLLLSARAPWHELQLLA